MKGIEETIVPDTSASSPVRFNGLELVVFPGVYPPHEDSFLLSRAVLRFARGRFLDLGCGTGLQGLAASLNKNVDEIFFVDVSEAAIANSQFNATFNRLSKPNAFLQSDLFSGLGKEKFDCIAFNPPYLPTAAGEKISGSLNSAFDGGKSGRKVTDRFLRQFPFHLNAGGIILMVDSSLAQYQKTIRYLKSRGFMVEKVGSQRFFFEEVVVIKASRK